MSSRHSRKGSPKVLKISGRRYDDAVGNPPSKADYSREHGYAGHGLGHWNVEPGIAVNPTTGEEIEILGPSLQRNLIGHWNIIRIRLRRKDTMPEAWLRKHYYPKDRLPNG